VKYTVCDVEDARGPIFSASQNSEIQRMGIQRLHGSIRKQTEPAKQPNSKALNPGDIRVGQALLVQQGQILAILRA
jgi:hypothetical protein